jgi:DNA-binding response OmpR family regulator
VLLVEDEPLVRAFAAEALRDAGFDVAEAASAE